MKPTPTLLLGSLLFSGCAIESNPTDSSEEALVAPPRSDRIFGSQLVAAGGHTCLNTAEGIRCWGQNTFGESGRRTGQPGVRGNRGPIRVAKFPGPSLGLAASMTSTCTLLRGRVLSTPLKMPDDGIVTTVGDSPFGTRVGFYCWGSPFLPLGSNVAGSGNVEGAPELVMSPALEGISTEEGRVRAWSMSEGTGALCFAAARGVQCITGGRTFRPAFDDREVTSVNLGGTRGCASDGRAITCFDLVGTNHTGVPVNLGAGIGAIQRLAVGAKHVCAVTDRGLYCGGDGQLGALGDGDWKTPGERPMKKVEGLPGVPSRVVANGKSTCAIVAGNAYCWGDNSFSKISRGDANLNDVIRARPARVEGVLGEVTEVALGANHACANTSEGVQCWGLNDHGQLGGRNSSAHRSATPIFVLAKATSP